jgi:hypothetical protein
MIAQLANFVSPAVGMVTLDGGHGKGDPTRLIAEGNQNL